MIVYLSWQLKSLRCYVFQIHQFYLGTHSSQIVVTMLDMMVYYSSPHEGQYNMAAEGGRKSLRYVQS